jgi:isopenicillin N synthase-like dioxygenase
MKTMDDATKSEYLKKHFRHRMTLLRTLRERKKKNESYQNRGDIYRCVKDSNLIAVRLWLDFMGLKGVRTASGLAL